MPSWEVEDVCCLQYCTPVFNLLLALACLIMRMLFHAHIILISGISYIASRSMPEQEKDRKRKVCTFETWHSRIAIKVLDNKIIPIVSDGP